jgi:hypothetical protein
LQAADADVWLQDVVESRLAYKDSRVDGLHMEELEEVGRESELLAAATLTVYSAYLSPPRGRAAHRGRELAGWAPPANKGDDAPDSSVALRQAAEAEAGAWFQQPEGERWETGLVEDHNGLSPFGSVMASLSLPLPNPPPPSHVFASLMNFT